VPSTPFELVGHAAAWYTPLSHGAFYGGERAPAGFGGVEYVRVYVDALKDAPNGSRPERSEMSALARASRHALPEVIGARRCVRVLKAETL